MAVNLGTALDAPQPSVIGKDRDHLGGSLLVPDRVEAALVDVGQRDRRFLPALMHPVEKPLREKQVLVCSAGLKDAQGFRRVMLDQRYAALGSTLISCALMFWPQSAPPPIGGVLRHFLGEPLDQLKSPYGLLIPRHARQIRSFNDRLGRKRQRPRLQIVSLPIFRGGCFSVGFVEHYYIF